MAASGGIRAGKAYVELLLKDQLGAGLNKVAAKLKSLGDGISSIGKTMAAAGAAITVPLIAAAKLSADAGAAIYDMSRRTGICVESLSLLSFMADLTGSSIETVEGAIRRMQKTIAGVADAAEGTTGSLDHLGISVAQIVGHAPDRQFEMIAGRIAAISDPTARAAATMKVFGRSGTEILPLINQLAALAAQAKKLGLVRTEESAKQMKDFQIAMLLAQKAATSLWSALAIAVIPILKKKSEQLMQITLLIRDWVRGHRELIATIFTVATGLALVGTSLFVLGKSISYFASGIGLAGKLLRIFGPLLGAIGTPLAILIGLLAVGGSAFIYFSGNAGNAITFVVGKFLVLQAIATDVLHGISDSLAAGDISLAARILWTGLKAAWIEGTKELQTQWSGFKATFVQTAAAAFYGAEEILVKVMAGWQLLFVQVASAFKEIWNAAISAVAEKFENMSRNRMKAEVDAKQASGKLTPKQAQSEKDFIDQQFDRQKHIRDQEEIDKAAEIERKRDAKVISIREELARKLKEISDNELAINSAASQNKDQEVADLETRRKELQKQLDDLRKRAAGEKKKVDDDNKAPKTRDLVVDPAKFDELANGGFAKKQFSSAGVFNVSALQSLQGTKSVQDRIAKATEDTAKNTKEMSKNKLIFV